MTNITGPEINVNCLFAFFDYTPNLRSLKFSRMAAAAWSEIIDMFGTFSYGLQRLEIEDCGIQPGDLMSLFCSEGVRSIEHVAVRRCRDIPSELKPNLQRLSPKLEWEPFWGLDVQERWRCVDSNPPIA